MQSAGGAVAQAPSTSHVMCYISASWHAADPQSQFRGTIGTCLVLSAGALSAVHEHVSAWPYEHPVLRTEPTGLFPECLIVSLRCLRGSWCDGACTPGYPHQAQDL